jgi:phytoene/squalene synthetase
LQVINHLQDCAKDFRALDRVYIPQDSFEAAGSSVEALAETHASPALKAIIQSLARRTDELLVQSRSFASQIRDYRLALEVSVIQRLAEDLAGRLLARDPLSERVHHRRMEVVALALSSVARFVPSLPHRMLASSHREATVR